MVADELNAPSPRARRRWVDSWMRGGSGRSTGPRPSAELRLLWRLSLSALNEAPRFKEQGMAHDSYWLAARLERARGEAQVQRLLLLALEAFNAKPRFAVPCERTDSYAIAARLGRWVRDAIQANSQARILPP
jgi:hypothetical protein